MFTIIMSTIDERKKGIFIKKNIFATIGVNCKKTTENRQYHDYLEVERLKGNKNLSSIAI